MQDYYYQKIISQLAGSIPAVFGVLRSDGRIIACTSQEMIGHTRLLSSPSVTKQMTIKELRHSDNQNRYIFIDSTSPEAECEASVLCASIEALENLLITSDEQTEYLMHILEHKTDAEDVYHVLQRLKIQNPLERYACLFHSTSCKGSELYKIISSTMYDANHDFLLITPRQNILVIKEMKKTKDLNDVLKDVQAKLNAVSQEYQIDLKAGISSVFEDIKDLDTAFAQAKNALDDCEIGTEKMVSLYDATSLISLVSQLSDDALRTYKDKILSDESKKVLDEETVQTIRTFLENNLSVAETSRALYINRNTLNYRLNRIKDETGFDLRNFYEAVKFCTAILIDEHLKHKESK